MKKKAKSKPKTLASQVSELRGHQYADFNNIMARMDSLDSTTKALASALYVHTEQIEELRKQVSMSIAALSLRLEIVERGHAELHQQAEGQGKSISAHQEIMNAFKPWVEDQFRCVSSHAKDIEFLDERIAQLEHLSGIHCAVTQDDVPEYMKPGTFVTRGNPEPRTPWRKFTKFLGF